MAPELKTLQGILYRLITAPEGLGDGREPATEAELPAGELNEIVRGDERLSASERLKIYSEAYFYRLLDALKEDFPATLAVLGAENFQSLVRAYLVEYPPTEPSIFYAGHFLADFIQRHRFRERWPFIADLARLERALIDVFHGPDAPALEEAPMRAVPPADWPALELRTHPALLIVDCEWEVAEVLRAAAAEGDWHEPARKPRGVLVWRQNAQVYYRELEIAERRALGLASRGATFAAICDAVAAATPHDEDPVATINRLLARWLADGVLAGPPVQPEPIKGRA